MAPFRNLLLLSLLFVSSVAASSDPIILPIFKDASTLQYVTHVQQRTPLVPLSLVVNLGGRFLWVNCQVYVSATYRVIPCRIPECLRADPDLCTDYCDVDPPFPGCSTDACAVSSDNLIANLGATSDYAEDVLSLPFSNLTLSHFYFQCAPSFMLEGLAANTSGMLGLARSDITFPSQLASTLNFPRFFKLCLSSSTTKAGAALFNVEKGNVSMYTPLIVSPMNREGSMKFGVVSGEYFIGLTSIKVKKRTVPIDTALLSIDRWGVGGTRLSTISPYTTLEPTIYKAVTDAFVAAMGNVTRVAAVAPLQICYREKEIKRSSSGPAVPVIDFVLQDKSAYWRMHGGNTMVRAAEGVLCLGFVDAGPYDHVTSVVIGGRQLEEMLLEFDVVNSRLGFKSLKETTCSRIASKP